MGQYLHDLVKATRRWQRGYETRERAVMTFKEVLAQVIEWLQENKRLSYRALQRQFDLDAAYLEDLKEELLYSHPVIDDGRGLVWTDEKATISPPLERSQVESVQPALAPEREPLSYTPQYLAEKILTSRSALEGERKQVTVLFADLKDSTERSKTSTRKLPRSSSIRLSTS